MVETLFNSAFSPDTLRAVGLWGLTLLAHSTVLLGLVWIIDRSVRSMRDDLREWLWRSAMVGGFISATLVTVLPNVSFAPMVSMPTVVTDTHATSATGSEAIEGALTAPVESLADVASLASIPSARTTSMWLLAIGLIGGAFIIFIAWRNTRTLGGDRIEVTHGPARRAFDDLLARSGHTENAVRLTVSDSIRSPGAFGLLRPEICVPHRSLKELSEDELRAMFAHELAHHARRDPFWTFCSLAAERLCFVQPLFHLARRRLRELAEFQADALAIRWTGDGLALASCLVRVGEWVRNGRALPALAGAMAQPSSPLEERVLRAVENSDETSIEPKQRAVRWGVLATAVVVSIVAIALATPRVRAVTDDSVLTAELDSLVSIERRADAIELEWVRLNEALAVVRTLAATTEISDEHAMRLASIEQRLRALDAERAALLHKLSAIEADVDSLAPTSAETTPLLR